MTRPVRAFAWPTCWRSREPSKPVRGLESTDLYRPLPTGRWCPCWRSVCQHRWACKVSSISYRLRVRSIPAQNRSSDTHAFYFVWHHAVLVVQVEGIQNLFLALLHTCRLHGLGCRSWSLRWFSLRCCTLKCCFCNLRRFSLRCCTLKCCFCNLGWFSLRCCTLKCCFCNLRRFSLRCCTLKCCFCNLGWFSLRCSSLRYWRLRCCGCNLQLRYLWRSPLLWNRCCWFLFWWRSRQTTRQLW